ncbi:hypothetical protein Poli38472_003646 [Pythium oligandrum]|uniref:PROP1-like PPR domain-containing protein n=1 Tax=Pythium oligandrum TaxID=41045 RepID=A0A8K1FKB8_PYTOL|nr:hypothetical protein Poli38472_003646 [Pythium oligandrum]|eukprot:TMW65881.1 hypothetical protein Poli38472_003646 [Pythium oligandrum]
MLRPTVTAMARAWRVHSTSRVSPWTLQFAAFASQDAVRPNRALSTASSHRKRPTTSPFGHQRHDKSGVTAQLQQLLSNASSQRNFEPDVDFLRQAATALQAVHTPAQLQAARPLCKLVERASTMQASAVGECVRVYEALGEHKHAIELAFRLLENDFFLMNSSLASALQACTARKELVEGFQLFEMALDRGTIPNRTVFSALFVLCGATGEHPLNSPRVQRTLEKMRESEVEMNHTLVHHWMISYAKSGHFDHVQTLFEAMESVVQLRPIENTYAILMDAYAVRGAYDQVMALLETLKKSDELKAALLHYNVALKACGKASELTNAFHLYEEMKDKEIKPDLVTYITMMHAVYHGELGVIDTKKVKAALAGVGAMSLAFVPFIDFEEHWLTALFCGSLVSSMGLAVYMNPDGALRALYPNSDEPQNDTIIEAFFRRLREEDHCGRSMYLWREMTKHGVAADSRVYDVLVRTCVKKRHPELAYEALFEQNLPLIDSESGQFVLPQASTISLLHSLLSQRRLPMADTLFDAARSNRVFQELFQERKDQYTYDLRPFNTVQTRSYAMRRILTQFHEEAKMFAGKNSSNLPDVQFLLLHGYDLLDQLDSEAPQLRALFSMDEMKKEPSGTQYYFRLNVSKARLAEFLANPVVTNTSL